MNVSCNATGNPDPVVKWVRSGQEKNAGSKTALITFGAIKRSDGGNYICEASNSVGRTNVTVTLVVHCE